MRFVHSYWTRPVIEKRWGYEPEELQRGDLLTFALSVSYIKKLGHEIVLYTDDKGKELLGSLSYDEIYTTLNDIPEDVPSMMWAYGKFFAMQNEPLGSIHIDGDVFIKSKECIEKIESGEYDVFCQNLDREPLTENRQIHFAAWKLLRKLDLDWGGYPTDGVYQYNVGILRFMNEELKKMYFNFFFGMVEQVKNSKIASNAIKQSAFCPISMISEQQFLYEMIQKHQYKVQTLIDRIGDNGYIDIDSERDYNLLGYEHILGAKKYHVIPDLEIKLQLLDFKTYETVMNHSIYKKHIQNDELKFVHSYWSKPAQKERWKIKREEQEVANILIQTLSVYYLKQLNQKVVLYTDDYGKKMFSHLPYDEVYTILNDIPEDTPSFIWAYGKFFAMQNEPLGSIHIDGDVYIKKQECIDKIKEGKYDVLLQNIECEPDTKEGVRIYSWSWDRLKNITFSNEFDWEHGYFGYNVGITRFMNQELKNRYFKFYFDNVNDIKNQVKAKKQLNEDCMACPDVILEQQALYEMINRDKFSVKLLLSNTKDFPITQLDAKNIGFQHLIGKKKYSLIPKVKETLLNLDKELYIKTMKHLKEMYGEWALNYNGIKYEPEFTL